MPIMRSLILFITLFFVVPISAQAADALQIGSPFIANYQPKDYNGDAQNWCALQDSNQFLYVGNQRGVLQFDGENWNAIPVLDGRAVFSLAKDASGTIWVGTHNDFGILFPDSIGRLKYLSYQENIPENLKPIGRVREIIISGHLAYIRTNKYLLRFNNGKIKSWQSPTQFYKMHQILNKIFIWEAGKGLKTVENDLLKMAPQGAFFKNNSLTAMQPYTQDTLLIATWKDGLYLYKPNFKQPQKSYVKKFKTQFDLELKSNPIIALKTIGAAKFFLAGFNKGSYLVDKNGRGLVKLTKRQGLTNLFCNNTYLDHQGGLWFLNNDGIDRVEISSPFLLFGEDEGIKGPVQNIVRYKNKLYIATTDKVYVEAGHPGKNTLYFKEIKKIQNVWSFLPLTNRLLAASSDGVYEIVNNKARLLSLGQKKTFTLFRSRIDSTKIYCGTSGGLALLEFRAGQWQYRGLIEGVKYEIHYIEEFPAGQLWLGTYNQGIIKAKIKTDGLDVEYFGLDDGLETLKLYIPIVLKGKLFFSSAPSSVLYFDAEKSRFFKEPQFLEAAQKISKIVEDEQGNVLFKRIVDEGARIVLGTYKNQFYSFSEKPFQRIKNINPIIIFPDKNGITWFGYKNGLLRHDSKIIKRTKTIAPALIRRVKFQDSLVYRGMNMENITHNRFNFPYQNNKVRFEFAFAGFDAPDQNAYQYFLDGYEGSWSDWTHESQKDYTNLPEGNYLFYVRGRDVYGQVSSADLFNFKILPPWYRSQFAYFTYIFIFLSGLFVVDRVRTRQIKRKLDLEAGQRLKRQKEIDKAKSEERKRVRKKTSADFHDELGHVLTKLTLLTELAKRSVNEKSETKRFLIKIGDGVSELATGMKDFIWMLDSDKDSLYDTLIRIKDFGDAIFEYSPISFRAGGFSEALEKIKIETEVRRNIVLVFKEAMNNCLKYSHAEVAEFSAFINDNFVEIIFSDNGKGFNTENKSSGHGLKNMHARSKKIGAEFLINSHSGKTEIRLKMKIGASNKNNPNE